MNRGSARTPAGHGALSGYQHALSSGQTAPLPQLYEAVGATLAFDSETLARAVHALEDAIHRLAPDG